MAPLETSPAMDTHTTIDQQWDMAVVMEPEGTDRVIYTGNMRIGGT